MSLFEHWHLIETELKKKIGDKSFGFWFSNKHLIKFTEKKLEIGVPGQFKKFVEFKIFPHLAKIVPEVTGHNPAIEAVLTGDYSRQDRKIKPVVSGLNRTITRKTQRQYFALKERYRLESFQLGKENEVLQSVLTKVVAEPGLMKHNPLVISAPPGNGKSHVAQGLTHSYIDNGYNGDSIYVTGDYFYSRYMEAYRKKTLKQFRDQFRNLSILVVDDLQSLSGKTNIAIEFLNLIDELVLYGKQVIVTLNNQLSAFENELPSKLLDYLSGGLVIDILKHSHTTQKIIINERLGENIKKYSTDTIDLLASNSNNSIRQIESYLQLLQVYISVNKRGVTKDIAETLLKDMDNFHRPHFDMMDIENAVLTHFNLTSKELHRNSRERKSSHPRQICMFLAAELTDFSLNQIGSYFLGRNHSTIHYAIKKIRQQIKHDQELKALINKIKSDLDSNNSTN